VTIDSVLLKDDGVNATNLEITNIKANDGTAAATIANSTGNFTITNFISNSVDIGGGAIDGTVIGGATAAAITGTTITGTSFVSSGDMTFGDDDKAIFGAGSDLQIYHDGSNSYVKDNGVGDLIIQAYDDIKFQQSTDNADLVTINTGGNVGIGTSSPVTLKSATTLQVSGNAKLGDDNGRGLLSLGDIASTGANAGIWRGAAGAYAGTGNYLNLGGYDGITFTTGAADISAQTERMRIDASGNVGIGTSSPSAALSISKQTTALSGTGNAYGLYLYPTSSGAIYVDAITGSASNTDLKLRSYNNGTYSQLISSSSGGTVTTFETGGSERMRIDSGGYVAIGTSSTGFNGQGLPLVVGSGTGSTGMTIFSGADSYGTLQFADAVTTGAASYAGVVSYNHTSNFMYFSTASTERMRIDSSGNLLSGTTTSKGSRVQAAGAAASASPTLGSATDTSLLLSNSDVTYGMNFGVINNGNGWIQQHSNTGTVSAYDLLLQPVGGNVGIGTSSPAEKLDISQSVNNSVITKVTNTNSGDLATARVEIHNNDSSFGQLTTYSSGFGYPVLGSSAANWTFIGSSGANSNGLKIGTLTADPIVFGTNDTERMVRLDASGESWGWCCATGRVSEF
jgi:hypothetical protein